jgi:hypothetical protein
MKKKGFEQRFAFEQRSAHRIEVSLIEAEVCFRTEVPLSIRTAFRAEVPLSEQRFAIEQRFPSIGGLMFRQRFVLKLKRRPDESSQPPFVVPLDLKFDDCWG